MRAAPQVFLRGAVSGLHRQARDVFVECLEMLFGFGSENLQQLRVYFIGHRDRSNSRSGAQPVPGSKLLCFCSCLCFCVARPSQNGKFGFDVVNSVQQSP